MRTLLMPLTRGVTSARSITSKNQASVKRLATLPSWYGKPLRPLDAEELSVMARTAFLDGET